MHVHSEITFDLLAIFQHTRDILGTLGKRGGLDDADWLLVRSQLNTFLIDWLKDCFESPPYTRALANSIGREVIQHIRTNGYVLPKALGLETMKESIHGHFLLHVGRLHADEMRRAKTMLDNHFGL